MTAPTIWKFPIDSYLRSPNEKITPTLMPAGAKILHVAYQPNLGDSGSGNACVWAEVHPQAVIEPRRLVLVGTGWSLPPEPRIYLGTAFFKNGMVFHLYELPLV